MNYDLSHLTQSTRRVYGPVQDDEALLLYALVLCMGVRTVLEVGGQTGYSARNFLAAGAEVFTIDVVPVPVLSDRHHVILADVGSVPLDGLPAAGLVFLDAHDEEKQWQFVAAATAAGVVTDATTLVVHDTGLHAQRFVDWAVPCDGRWAHQPADRRLVNRLADAGWQSIHVHDDVANEPRHGLTILQRPRRLS